MFTGLIKEIGSIKKIEEKNGGISVTINAKEILIDSKIGDSISVNGICSTITQQTQSSFTVEYMPETLKKTALKTLTTKSKVNLEPCLTLQDKLGGHIVTGHIDTTGTIKAIEKDKKWQTMTIEFPHEFNKLIIQKGSIALDGISLTLSHISDHTLSVSLIPHTINHTNLKTKKNGDLINIEFDILGKYIERFQKKENGDKNEQ